MYYLFSSCSSTMAHFCLCLISISFRDDIFFFFIGIHTNLEEQEVKYFNSGPVLKTSPDLYSQIPYATSNSGPNLKSVSI